ncbi:hypothetical protein FGO68_gene6526 [Halteria grandinella]|uniref:Uncharacterized protein n=1 Tax=Halteria grandinella TaxID=5974 RepID=A0A8J8T0V0_HALGN|nr:hypothetical protein FGO68_gene6526 [Halteria grandinella]
MKSELPTTKLLCKINSAETQASSTGPPQPKTQGYQALNVESLKSQEVPKRSLKELFENNLFIMYSTGSAICFGIHSYMQAWGMMKWRNNVSILFPEFIPLLIIPIIYHLNQGYKHVKPEHGSIWSKHRSVFFDKDTSAFRFLPLLFVVLRSIGATLIPVNISWITYLCKEVGLNAAVVQSFSTFSSFTTALLFYILYKERLTAMHIIGMLMIIGSLLIVAVGKQMSSNNPQTHSADDDLYLTTIEEGNMPTNVVEVEQTLLNILIPFMVVFTTCLLLTKGAYLSRAARSVQYPPIQFVTDFSIGSGLIYLAAFLYQHFYVEPYPLACILFMATAGIAICCAFQLLNLSVLSGKGALSMAISQTQNFFWLFFDMVLSLRFPFVYEAVAMGVGICGACIITLAKK